MTSKTVVKSKKKQPKNPNGLYLFAQSYRCTNGGALRVEQAAEVTMLQ